MNKHRILNLGAGIQPGTIYALMVDGEIEPADVAVFADTQEEPIWVYQQLDYLRSLTGPPIVTVTAGKIGDDLARGRNSTGGRFASIPAHTTYAEGQKGGITRRQCTREYKIEPIEKYIRRVLLNLKPRQHIPKDTTIINLFGFSTDESRRAVKMRQAFAGRTQWTCEFPLLDENLRMTRLDCQNYIEKQSGFHWRSSRCVFCPLQRNRHFLEIKEHDPEGWQRALAVDESLRSAGSVVNRGMDERLYVHRSCRPLDAANLDEGQSQMFQDDGECDEGCFT